MKSEAAGHAPVRREKENNLGKYFNEMSELSVLKPEQEFEAAKKIEGIELELWTHLLSEPTLLDVIDEVMGRNIERSPKLSGLRRSAASLPGKRPAKLPERFLKVCARTAAQVYQADVDRIALFALIEALRAIGRGDAGLTGAAADVNAKTKAFRAYLKQAGVLFAAAQRARNDFVKANLRLVVSIARRFNHGRMPLSDLIQEGNIGLIKAVERYDYRRGYRFSTYASWWIRHAISRALADKGRAVRLPVHMIDAHHKLSRSRRQLSSRLGRQPTAEELDQDTGLGLEKVRKLESYLMDQAVSLDRLVADGDGRRFVELLHDPDAVLPSEQLADQRMGERVHDIMSQLKPIEADILRRRFGLTGDDEQTLKEIGDQYKLSRERIRQLQEQALGKIRQALEDQDVF